MKKIGTLLLVVLIPLMAFAAEPTVVQNPPKKNITNTLHISATVTPGPGQTLREVYGVVKNPPNAGFWVQEAFLGRINPPFQGNTSSTYAKGTKLKIAIMVYYTENNTPKSTIAGELDYTVP